MTRTMKDVALLTIELFDECKHFNDVAGDMTDAGATITFAVDGVHYEVAISPMSAERKAEVYGE